MQLQEFVQSTPSKISNGLIEGVHILGYESKNNRAYSKAAIKNAVKLYEGIAVYVDHAPGKARKAEDRFGQLINVRESEDGLRGDLKYLTTHPIASRINEDLSKDLKFFGLSHDAQGTGLIDRSTGKIMIESIDSVTSVDLVSGAASVKSLLEQVDSEKSEMQKLLECVNSLRNELKEVKIKLTEQSVTPPKWFEAPKSVDPSFKMPIPEKVEDKSLDEASRAKNIKKWLSEF